MNQRIVVVGGGVIGAAIALQLAEEKRAAVTVIERGSIGGESSWAGAGLLSSLLPWQYSEPVNQLVQSGRKMFPEWAGRLALETGIDPEYRVSGMLVLPPYDEIAAMSWGGESRELIERVSARSRLAALEEDGPALWLPQVAQVRNPRLLRSMRAALLMRGVMLHEGVTAHSLKISQKRVEAVETSSGLQQADTFIITAGAWTGTFLSPHASIAIKPVRGQIVLLKGPPGLLPHIVYRDGFYVIPRQDGHILLGSTLEDVGFDKQTTDRARAEMLAQAHELLPVLKSLPVVRQWSGLRPGSPENIPFIGRHPVVENLYICSGHYRYGVTMAPSSARLLADLIAGRQPIIQPEPYRWRG